MFCVRSIGILSESLQDALINSYAINHSHPEVQYTLSVFFTSLFVLRCAGIVAVVMDGVALQCFDCTCNSVIDCRLRTLSVFSFHAKMCAIGCTASTRTNQNEKVEEKVSAFVIKIFKNQMNLPTKKCVHF